MKILSYNSRGFGGVEKQVELRHLIQEHRPFVLCLQVSKLSSLYDALVRSLWGDAAVEYSYQP